MRSQITSGGGVPTYMHTRVCHTPCCYVIGDVLIHSHDSEFWGSSANWSKKKTITINTLSPTPSTIRVKFDLKTETGAGAYARVYKNGVVYGIERFTTSGSYITFTEDLSYNEGDTVELWIKDGTGGFTYVGCQNFRVYGDRVTPCFAATNS